MNVVNQAFTVDDVLSEKGQAVKLGCDVTIRLRDHQRNTERLNRFVGSEQPKEPISKLDGDPCDVTGKQALQFARKMAEIYYKASLPKFGYLTED